MTPPPLPKQTKVTKNKTYKLAEFVGKSDEYIKNSGYDHIAVDYDTLVDNFDLLKHILEITKKGSISCYDYESALLLESILPSKISLDLVDDYRNKDRSYIDTSMFENHPFSMPLSYVMWNPHFKEKCDIRCFRNAQSDAMTSLNGNTSISKDTIKKLYEIVNELNVGEDDLEKILLVSNYIQSKIQYVECGKTVLSDGTYVPLAPLKLITREIVSSIENIINKYYGLCMGIANTTTLLLNNPIMNVNVRSLYGCEHAWNLVKTNDTLYYVDNTWSITLNPSRLPSALKALDLLIKLQM